MKNILLIGPLENKNDSTKTGGIIVLFADLLRQFDKHKINYTVIDTNKENYPHKLIALLCIWFQLLIKTPRYQHLSLHGTANDYVFIAPVAVLLAKLFGKSVSLRKFAGNFDEIYDTMNVVLKSIVSLSLKKSDANFFETRYLVSRFVSFNHNTYWFPNVREKPDTARSGGYQKRFIFIGSITREKGIMELLEASNLLDDSYTIDLYGPIAADFASFDFRPYHAVYKKALNPAHVLETLRQYDVLILPSYREGYPGVIIEALSLGIPIIATGLEGIKEMIDEKCAIFLTPQNTKDIKNSVMYFNEENYNFFSTNALRCFEPFDSDVQTNRFLSLIILKE
jgi:glycosyltransferase involved in cell wall biosynthesis